MELFAALLGWTLPMGVLIFVGSYFGVWHRRHYKASTQTLVKLFGRLWLLAATLLFTFHVLAFHVLDIPSQDAELIRLWGPLVLGIVIGRGIVHRQFGERDQSSSRP